ncbi:glycoside hydrolase family 35 protein [Glaciibacter flavus]|uniref:glycoside hydrolase family 35 protein n=1 Tax=Orlajensenia flava TaxID=2565934 RepID=UPI003B000ACC
MPTHPVSRFAIGDSHFLRDGEPFRILSGALHYFRVHPDLWLDRIRKAKQMGLNTIETYIVWNEHCPRRGDFNASGQLDLARFLDLIHEEGMCAIVRPGPYICAEWDGGGLPAWLFADGSVGVRSSDPGYLEAVAEYFDSVLPIVAARQIDDAGPVILVQIENEYGAYGDDKAYLGALVELTRAHGITVPLTTVDQPIGTMLANGSLPGLLKTASFGSRSAERLATLRAAQPTGPLMCSEFWDGWFDSWGTHHHTTPVEHSAEDLDELLSTGASVNLYMFHGGTNFGFTSGANDKGTYSPIVTSYDYDAPLDELGEPGPKYWAYRDVIAKYSEIPVVKRSEALRPRTFTVPLERGPSLLSARAARGPGRQFDRLPTMDEAGHFRGFLLYRTRLARGGQLRFSEIRDRADFLLDGVPIGTLSREHHERAIQVPRGGDLDVLVEDQGRVSYGARIGESKGLIGPVHLDEVEVVGWSTVSVDLAAELDWETPDDGGAGQRFHRAEFEATPGEPLILSTVGWGKGVALMNGFNLGRYWSRGPQRSLVVPGRVVRSHNELRVFEQNTLVETIARFVAHLDLGHVEP